MAYPTYEAHELAISLAGDLHAPAAARVALGRIPGLDRDSRETLALLVSELVTNSVVHGGLAANSRVTLTVSVSDAIAVAVSDPGGGFSRRAFGPRREGEGGWGLQLVERLARRWGIDAGPPTMVWFELERAAAGRRRRLTAS
jgi:two-component sensor histidine kinase